MNLNKKCFFNKCLWRAGHSYTGVFRIHVKNNHIITWVTSLKKRNNKEVTMRIVLFQKKNVERYIATLFKDFLSQTIRRARSKRQQILYTQR